MGAWNTGPFDNDDAGDFVGDLLREGLQAVGGVLQIAFDVEELEAPEASQAVAAAAFLAAVNSGQDQLIPKELKALAKECAGSHPELILLARKVLSRVVDASELEALWSEADDYEDWLGSISAIRRQLA